MGSASDFFGYLVTPKFSFYAWLFALCFAIVWWRWRMKALRKRLEEIRRAGDLAKRAQDSGPGPKKPDDPKAS